MSDLPLNIDIQQIFLHLFNFSILALGLYFLLYKPVLSFIKKREEYYQEQDKKAKETQASLNQELIELKEKEASLLGDVEAKKQAVEESLETRKQKSLEETQVEATRILELAKRQAEREKAKIVEDANQEVKQIVESVLKEATYASDAEAIQQFLTRTEVGEKHE